MEGKLIFRCARNSLMALPAWPYDPPPYFTTDLHHWLVGESVCLAVGHVYTKQQRLEAYAHRTCTPSARWQHDSWTNYTLCWMEMLLQIVLADNNNNNNGRNSSVCYGRTTEMTSEIVFFLHYTEVRDDLMVHPSYYLRA